MREIDVSPEMFRDFEQISPGEEVVLKEWCERLDQRARFHWGRERTPEELAAHDTGYTGRRKVVVASMPHSQKIGAEVSAAERIAAERRRQIESEGWTPEHDDEHTGGAMAQAAACYAIATVPRYAGCFPIAWPWSPQWDKRPLGSVAATTDVRVRALEKAGALIAAEIDRLLRRQERFERGEDSGR